MKIYNTKTLKKEEFKPITEGEVKMYVCGPTVYDNVHIGNVRPVVVFDTLRRTFEELGYKVKYVSNYTDVDDKIIRRSKELGISEKELTDEMIAAYNDIRHKLNAADLYKTPRVTETMDEIISFIDGLVDKGAAYEKDGDVYFRTSSVADYGSLSNQNLDDLQVGARIEENDLKESPLDFALWKKTEDGIKWPTRYSIGRPGWHTECVVMINNNMGDMIDIHGGGMDLKFPHHENEVAQQEALHHNCLANYWVHNAMVNIDGQKMSKSLGNTLWAKDVVEKLGTNLTRWLVSSVHYRKELNFSEETIETARKELEKVLNPLKQVSIKEQLAGFVSDGTYDEESYNAFLDCMCDDMNTPNAYAVIFDTVKKINQGVRVKDIDFATVDKYVNSVEKMLKVLGITVDILQLSEEDKALFNAWNTAKKEKNFDEADKARNALMQKGLL